MDDPPEEFPTALFLLVGLCVLIGVLAIAAFFVTAGIGGLLIGGLLIIAVGVPMAIHKMKRRTPDADDVSHIVPHH